MEQLTDFVAGLVTIIVTLFASVIGLLVASYILEKVISKTFYRKKVEKSLTGISDKVILFIKTPPGNDKKEAAMEAFLLSLHRVVPTGTSISLEMVSSGQFLRFYIVVAKEQRHIIESQLYAQFPEADIEEVKDYFSRWETNTAFIELSFKHHSMRPFKTHTELGDDLLKNLSAILAKTDPDEEVGVQLVLERVGSKSYRRGVRALYHQFTSSSVESPAQAKLSKNLFIGKLRFAYRAKNIAIATAKLHTLVNLYKGVKGSHNELKKKKPLFSEDLSKAFKTRLFEKGELWSIPELATLYHFPSVGTIVSNVVQTNSKRAPSPDILPSEGNVDPSEVSFIGQTNYRSENKVFGLKRFDRRRHLYVVGKTGSGKSKLLELLLKADIENGDGCCLIDPHGDLAVEVLKFVPKERINDVVYVDPIDRNFPVGFNPLEPVEDYEMRQHLSTFFIATFKKLFGGTWNPRMENLIRYITLALLETPDSNVLGISRILSDTAYRQRVIKQIQDPVVKGFWTNDFKPSDAQYANEAIVPLTNKIGQFVSNPMIRNIIGQKKNVLQFDKFMNEGKIVIINLSKGKLGEENTALLGSMFITKIQQAALARSGIPESQRRDFYFYVDEFQNFATDAFSSILSEARKYRLDLTIAHQYIAQLPEDVRATAFGNVGTIIVFGVGGDDAAYLAKEFSPTFTPDDLTSLNTREMYIKMSIDGKITPPFSATTLTVQAPERDYTDEIINHSRMKYSQTRAGVENEIARWSDNTTAIDKKDDEGFPEPII
ncbi:MAG: type IV secretion system DNA-binding domain-containing protein [Candidatus Levybacteria bacterium]|nr:type IV secretion system DNA-binding domain-containing protein [Candidatus Levybacteria bacterium]